MDIVVLQIHKLIWERWMHPIKACRISVEQQKKKGMIKEWKVIDVWKILWAMSKEQRDMVREAVKNWADINKFKFINWEVYYE